jgi:hypothetical protein
MKFFIKPSALTSLFGREDIAGIIHIELKSSNTK